MSAEVVTHASVREAAEAMDSHVRNIIQWHFSPESGCPFWLEWADKAGWNPAREVQCFADLTKFGQFEAEWLRGGPSLEIPPEVLQQDIFIESAGLGDATTMLEMIEHGVDINGHNPVFGHTALIVASRFGHYKIVQTLLDRGAEVNADCFAHRWLVSGRLAGR